MPDGRTRVTLHRRHDGVAEKRAAGAAITFCGGYELAPEAWPLPEDGEIETDPYGNGGLFHDGAFQLVQRIVSSSDGSMFDFDAGRALAETDGDPTILLDTLFHGFPHHQPERWYGAAAANMAAFPYRLESFTLHEALPRSGRLMVLTRRIDMPTARTVRFGVQVLCDGRVVAGAVMVEALLPTAIFDRVKPADRRRFCQDRVPTPEFQLSGRAAGRTSLTVETLQAANWLPGTFQAICDVPAKAAEDPRKTVERIAIEDHVAAIYAIHPAAVRIAGDKVYPGEEAPLPLSTRSRRWIEGSRFEVEESSEEQRHGP